MNLIIQNSNSFAALKPALNLAAQYAEAVHLFALSLEINGLDFKKNSHLHIIKYFLSETYKPLQQARAFVTKASF